MLLIVHLRGEQLEGEPAEGGGHIGLTQQPHKRFMAPAMREDGADRCGRKATGLCKCVHCRPASIRAVVAQYLAGHGHRLQAGHPDQIGSSFCDATPVKKPACTSSNRMHVPGATEVLPLGGPVRESSDALRTIRNRDASCCWSLEVDRHGGR